MVFFFAEIAVMAVRPLVLLMGICRRVAMVVARLCYRHQTAYCPRDLHTSRFTRTVVMTGHAVNIKTLSKPDCFFLYNIRRSE
jgi:hypothetical protein